MKTALAAFLLVSILCFSCAGDKTSENVAKIGVDFVWDIKNHQRSPEIHLESVPAGADRLQIQFYDATAEYEHGGGSLPYDGSGTIPAGAIKGYKTYATMFGIPKFRVEVMAFSKNGELVGKGTVTKKPPDE